MPNYSNPVPFSYKNRQTNQNVEVNLWRVNSGAVPGDLTGDPLPTGAEKINRAIEAFAAAIDQLNINDNSILDSLAQNVSTLQQAITNLSNDQNNYSTQINETITTIQNSITNIQQIIQNLGIETSNLEELIQQIQESLSNFAPINSPHLQGIPRIISPIDVSATGTEIVTAQWVRAIITEALSNYTPPGGGGGSGGGGGGGGGGSSTPVGFTDSIAAFNDDLGGQIVGLDLYTTQEGTNIINMTPGGAIIFNDNFQTQGVSLPAPISFDINQPFDPTNLTGSNKGVVQSTHLPLSPFDTLHFYLIGNGASAAMWATKNIDSPLPSGYTYRRRVGSIILNQNALAYRFRQTGNAFRYHAYHRIVREYEISTTGEYITFLVPKQIQVEPKFQLRCLAGSAHFAIICTDGDKPHNNFDSTFSNAATANYYSPTAFYVSLAGSSWWGSDANLAGYLTDTQGRLYFVRAGNYYGTGVYRTHINIMGYIDPNL